MALLASRSRSCVFWSRLLPRSSLALQKTQERNVAVRSEQFPEYSLIYDFDKIRTASKFCKIKMQATVLTATGSPAIFMAEHLGYLAPYSFNSFVYFGCALTVFLHSVGYLFNDVIGYIYLKDDKKSIKISHVGYWGERVDVDTTIDQICAFNDLPTSLLSNPWYQRVRLANSKKTYKMYLTAGKVLDDKIFTGIFGKVY